MLAYLTAAALCCGGCRPLVLLHLREWHANQILCANASSCAVAGLQGAAMPKVFSGGEGVWAFSARTFAGVGCAMTAAPAHDCIVLVEGPVAFVLLQLKGGMICGLGLRRQLSSP